MVSVPLQMSAKKELSSSVDGVIELSMQMIVLFYIEPTWASESVANAQCSVWPFFRFSKTRMGVTITTKVMRLVSPRMHGSL